jgi:hypothetical protein
MSIQNITTRENVIIDSMIDKLRGIYRDEIIVNVQKYEQIELMLILTEQIDRAIERMTVVVEEHLRSIFNLEIFFQRTPTAESEYLLRQFLVQSRYPNAFANMKSRLQIKIGELSGEYIIQQFGREYFDSLLMEIINSELSSLETIAVWEGMTAVNQARSLAYEIEDIYGEYEYYWSIYHDKRTSPQCKEIERRVNERGGAVPLAELKEILRVVALEYDPDYTYREFSPHYHCRSRLIRKT